MIGRLRGVVLEKQPPNLLIDVQGVGYEVLAPMTTFYHLPELGSEVVLHTHLAVSETAQQLYGFYQVEARSLFRLLIKVNGVGPKMALGILSGMDAAEFASCVSDNNVPALVKVPGVGKKTAERLVIEMRDRIKDWYQGDGANPITSHHKVDQGDVSNQSFVIAEAESALIALGYKPTDASKAVNAVLKANEVSRSEDLIRLALRSMLP